MWSSVCAGILLVLALPMVLIIYWMVTAPDGWEDEAGFHYGSQYDKFR